MLARSVERQKKQLTMQVTHRRGKYSNKLHSFHCCPEHRSCQEAFLKNVGFILDKILVFGVTIKEIPVELQQQTDNYLY